MYQVDEINRSGIVAFEAWLMGIGKSNTTGWRWRTRGWIETLNISGRVYVTKEEIDRFTARAQKGEFATTAKVPRRKAAQ